MSPHPHDRPSNVLRRDNDTVVVVLRGTTEVATWRLQGRGSRPDLGLVDELARLQLSAQRLGCSVRVRHPSPQLTELLDLIGLREVVGREPGGLVVEMGGETEEGEQTSIEVDEHGELDNPTL